MVRDYEFFFSPMTQPISLLCPACGSRAALDDKFCGDCGAVLRPVQGPLPENGRSRLLVLCGVFAILVLGAVALFAKTHRAEEPSQSETATARPPASAQQTARTVLDLAPFTVNLQPEDGDHYLQANMTLSLGPGAHREVTAHLAEVRSKILMILASKKASSLTTSAGKQALAREIRESLSQRGPGTGFDVEDVFFTGFIIQ